MKIQSQVFRMVFALLAFSLCSCKSSVYLPDQTFMTPETSGGLFRGNIGIGIRSMTEVTVFNDVDQTPPVASGASIQDVGPVSVSVLPLGLLGSLGLWDYLDVIYLNGYGLKFGFPTQGDGFKASIAYVRESFSFGTPYGGNGFQAGVQKSSVLFSQGYRWNEKYLAYLNYAREWFEIRSEIMKSQAVTYSYSDGGLHQRIGIGVEISETQKIKLLIEGSFVRTSFPRADDSNSQSIGFAAKYIW